MPDPNDGRFTGDEFWELAEQVGLAITKISQKDPEERDRLLKAFIHKVMKTALAKGMDQVVLTRLAMVILETSTEELQRRRIEIQNAKNSKTTCEPKDQKAWQRRYI